VIASRRVSRHRVTGRRPSATDPPTASSLLRLIWLASPALPVGGFSYSEGLEAAVDAGTLTTETAAADWLLDQLHLGLARSELAVLAKAMRAWQRDDRATVQSLNHWVATTRETSELRQQSEQMGRSLALWLANTEGDDARIDALRDLQPAPTWPIAWALAAARSGAPLRDALLAHAFGWAENLVQAALKAIPLGQNAGQRVLSRLLDAIPAAVDRSIALDAGSRQAFLPMLAILSAQHESQYSRLFRS
jgi:urease accessory protein